MDRRVTGVDNDRNAAAAHLAHKKGHPEVALKTISGPYCLLWADSRFG